MSYYDNCIEQLMNTLNRICVEQRTDNMSLCTEQTDQLTALSVATLDKIFRLGRPKSMTTKNCSSHLFLTQDQWTSRG
jgi:hypothetical protein